MANLKLTPGAIVGRRRLVERVIIVSPPSKRVVYWLAICACGTEKLVAENTLRRKTNGVSLSCGCYRRERLLKAGQLSALRLLLRHYQRQDIAAGRVSDLTDAELLKIVTQDCFHCDLPPNRVVGRRRKGKGSFLHTPLRVNTLDRIQGGSMGHLRGNVVASCLRCNIERGRQTIQEFWERRAANLDALVQDLVADGVTVVFVHQKD